MHEDRTFFDTFMLILAGLIIFAVAMYVVAIAVADRTIADRHVETPDARAALAERIAPVGRLCEQGREEECEVELAAVEAVATVPDAADEPADIDGQAVYNRACTACHGIGVAGAPRTGDTGAWAARVEKGYDTLLRHSIEGFQGDTGFMPARGGNPRLSDGEVAAALDYMLEQLEN
jgi:cytochrome c5